MIDRERPREGGEPLDIGKSQLDAVGIEPAGHGDAAAQRAHDPFVEQRQQRGAEPFEDRETQRIRADVDDRDAAIRSDQIPIGHWQQG